ncbi:hypothetical protein [Planctomycetes bacterium K23_9]|uniref:Secreted protein n=1 Tax=Stieleria marina TaxID=1930275 RepID=A0A517NT63_9BACT|nr:hypothetical protein K239x_22610 [Planctomycetes bacterium K23_9]
MKKAPFYLLLCFTLCFSISGCGGNESQVIEAPAETSDGSAMEGMSDEEYNKAMNESMKQQGN